VIRAAGFMLIAMTTGRADEAVRIVDVGSECQLWAVEPVGGTIWARSKANELTEIDPSRAVVRRKWTVSGVGGVAAVVARGRRVTVLRRGDPSVRNAPMRVQSLDLDTGSWGPTVPVTGRPESLVAPSGETRRVWYITPFRSGASIFAVDVESGDHRLVSHDPGSWGVSSAESAVFSADGHRFLIANDDSVRALFAVDDGIRVTACGRERFSGRGSRAPRLSIGPDARVVSIGRRLFAARDLGTPCEIDGEAVILHPQYDLAVAVRPRAIHGYAGSDVVLELLPLASSWPPIPPGAEAATSVVLPKTMRIGSHGLGLVSSKLAPSLMFDAHDRLVYARGAKAAIIDLTAPELAVPLEIPLGLHVVEAVEAVVRSAIHVPIRTTGVDAGSPVDLELTSGPDGARIADGVVAWKPRTADVGRHRFVVRARSGRRSVEATFSVQVNRPTVELPFNAGGVHVSSDGRTAVVSSATSDSAEDRTMWLAAVDLETMSLLAARELDGRSRRIALAGTRVYVDSDSGLLSFDREDLSPQASDEHDGAIALPGGRRGLWTRSGRFEVLEASTLARWDDGAVRRGEVARLGGGRWLVGDACVDDAGSALFLIGRPLVDFLIEPISDKPVVPRRWNRELEGGVLCGELPLRVEVGRRIVGEKSRGRYAVEVRYSELVDGVVIDRSIVWEDAQLALSSGSASPTKPAVAYAAGKVIVVDRRRLLVADLPAGIGERVERPLEIVPLSGAPIAASIDDVVAMRFTARGGVAPYRYEVHGTSLAPTIDPATGALSIDLRTAWREWPRRLEAGATRLLFQRRSELLLEDSPRGRFQGVVHTKTPGRADEEAAWKRLVRQDLAADRSALAASVRVRVIDARYRAASIDLVVMVSAPRKEAEALRKRARRFVGELEARERELRSLPTEGLQERIESLQAELRSERERHKNLMDRLQSARARGSE